MLVAVDRLRDDGVLVVLSAGPTRLQRLVERLALCFLRDRVCRRRPILPPLNSMNWHCVSTPKAPDQAVFSEQKHVVDRSCSHNRAAIAQGGLFQLIIKCVSAPTIILLGLGMCLGLDKCDCARATSTQPAHEAVGCSEGWL